MRVAHTEENIISDERTCPGLWYDGKPRTRVTALLFHNSGFGFRQAFPCGFGDVCVPTDYQVHTGSPYCGAYADGLLFRISIRLTLTIVLTFTVLPTDATAAITPLNNLPEARFAAGPVTWLIGTRYYHKMISAYLASRLVALI